MSPGWSLHKNVPNNRRESSPDSLPVSWGRNMPENGEKNPPKTLPGSKGESLPENLRRISEESLPENLPGNRGENPASAGVHFVSCELNICRTVTCAALRPCDSVYRAVESVAVPGSSRGSLRESALSAESVDGRERPFDSLRSCGFATVGKSRATLDVVCGICGWARDATRDEGV